MLEHLSGDEGEKAVAIGVISPGGFEGWLAGETAETKSWAEATRFDGEPGAVGVLTGPDGAVSRVVFVADPEDPWSWAALPARLPKGRYRIEEPLSAWFAYWVAVAWELAAYRFTRYKTPKARDWPELVWPRHADRDHVRRTVEAIFLVRDLVNTPASDLSPAELADAAGDLARRSGGTVQVISGDALLDANYPLIHAVGRASSRPPRLIDLVWGDETAPRVTLVGKGVCFDSGGLDLKPSGNMKLMKKDMGGAAHVLGLASMIMDTALPVRLRVLVPAVDNAVSGSAYRPLDVLKSRQGKTVEVGNTDAEGRLILADCLAEASRERPDLLVDMATLTGSARSALGPDLPAFFSRDDGLALETLASARSEHDPLWRLPLWKPYRSMLDSKVADICSAPDSAFAGAITAALFLGEFVPPQTPWAHLDIYAWNQNSRPGRPEGGEAMSLRALFDLIAKKFPL